MSKNPIRTPLHEPAPSSGVGAFLRGFGSGAINGALMMGLLFGLTVTAGWLVPTLVSSASVLSLHFLANATLASLATGMFGGIMAARRVLFDATPHKEHSVTLVPVPTMSGPAIAPVITPDIAPMPDAVEQAPASRWTDRASSSASESRIQDIIANGALSDKARASAILAAREVETATDISASRR